MKQKDIDKIREIIREELTIKDVPVERVNANGIIERKTIDMYLPEWIAAELPNLAGAMRGVQETADHAKNNSFKTSVFVAKAFEELADRIEDGNKTIKNLMCTDVRQIESDS